jgi:hypothetical protein
LLEEIGENQNFSGNPSIEIIIVIAIIRIEKGKGKSHLGYIENWRESPANFSFNIKMLKFDHDKNRTVFDFFDSRWLD